MEVLPVKNENPTEIFSVEDMRRNSHHRADGRGETVGEIGPEGSTVREKSAEWRSCDRVRSMIISVRCK